MVDVYHGLYKLWPGFMGQNPSARYFFSKLQANELPICRDEFNLVVCGQAVSFYWPDLGPSVIDGPTDPFRRQL